MNYEAVTVENNTGLRLVLEFKLIWEFGRMIDLNSFAYQIVALFGSI